MITRRRFLKWCGAGVGLGLGSGLYTWRVEPHWLEVVERALPVANLPNDLAGSRLIQLTDLHIGPQVDDDYLLHCFERTRKLDPDFVAYTGDFITYDQDGLARAERLFPRLPQGRSGTVGVPGNHDYGPNWADATIAARVSAMAESAGVHILRNESVAIRGLRFVGLDDPWAGRFDLKAALARVEPGDATVVLSHNPDTADLDGWDDYSGWILAGHTHGGQCKPPFLPPPILPVKNRRFTAGEFQLPRGRRMYISRGLGHLLRVRFNVRPEITAFTLLRV